MSRKASKRASFSPDMDDKPTILLGHGGSAKHGRSRKRVASTWSFRLTKESQFSPSEFFRRLGDKATKVLRCVSSSRSSRKVSSSMPQFVRSRSLADQSESHRAEAIEDCIKFLNSSCSLRRSNSVASAC
ncbi:uncharacterized protein LOC115756204 [Rhodamnia argentea]|uniref:Uncharacterized protein LOC115756204 n=1 Tax=Rhodamnia argentea TaxID=178133 RepID=A0A8B8QX27_9MYRT|nr:uncharacterized protein LOC115756204 [Rhodamnia argentea]